MAQNSSFTLARQEASSLALPLQQTPHLPEADLGLGVRMFTNLHSLQRSPAAPAAAPITLLSMEAM